MDIESLRRLKKEIWIWGAKNSGIDTANILKRYGIACAGFIDNSGIAKESISSSSFFAKKKKEDVFVIIASRQYYIDIESQCQKFGLIKEQGYTSCFDFLGPSYEIDLISCCNLRCPSCPQGNYFVKLPAAKMTFDYFSKVVDKILEDTPLVSHVSLFCWSEPFLCNDLAKFIALLKEKNISSQLSSNMSHLFDLEKVISAGIDYLRISVSGFFQETYVKDHAGGNIYLVKSNLYKLRYLLDKYKSSTYVEVVYHKYNYNCGDDLTKMKELCEELRFSFAPFSVLPLPIENILSLRAGGIINSIGDMSRFLHDASRDICYLKKLNLDDCSSKDIIPILPDGKVLVCDFCYDINDSVISDDFLKISYDEIIDAKRKNAICLKCLKNNIPLLLNTIIDDTGNDTKILYGRS